MKAPSPVLRPIRSRVPIDRRLWTIQPAPDVRLLVDLLAKKQEKAGHNRNHSLNRALRIGMKKVLREEGVAA